MASNADTAFSSPTAGNYKDIHSDQHKEFGVAETGTNEAAHINHRPQTSELMSNSLSSQSETLSHGTERADVSEGSGENKKGFDNQDGNNDGIISAYKNEIVFLRGEVKALREQIQRNTTDLLHVNQEHTTAITEKRRETEDLQTKLEMEKSEHQQTKNKLEEMTTCRNKKEIEFERLQLDYNACLEALATANTESEVRARDRDKHNKETRFYEAEGKRLTEEIHQLQQRNNDLNKSITILNTESRNEIQRLESENASLAKKITTLEEHLEKVLNGQDNQSLHSLVSAPSLNLSSILSLADSDQDHDSLHDPRLASTRSHDEPADSIGFKRFKVTPSRAPYCRNCGMVFNGPQAHMKKCGFHAAPPQPYQVWKDQLDMPKDQLERMHPDNKYWPCCGKISRHEPPGCKVLPRHDLVNPLDPED